MTRKLKCKQCNRTKARSSFNEATGVCKLCISKTPVDRQGSFNEALKQFKQSPKAIKYETWEQYKSRNGLKKPIYQRLGK